MKGGTLAVPPNAVAAHGTRLKCLRRRYESEPQAFQPTRASFVSAFRQLTVHNSATIHLRRNHHAQSDGYEFLSTLLI